MKITQTYFVQKDDLNEDLNEKNNKYQFSIAWLAKIDLNLEEHNCLNLKMIICRDL